MTTPSLLSGLALICAGLLTVSAEAADGQDDPILEAVRAEAESVSPTDFALTKAYTDNSGDTRQRLARYDPRDGKERPWRLLERNESEPSAKYRQRYEKNNQDPPPSYAKVLRFLDGKVSRLEENEEEIVYHIDRLGEGSLVFEGEDISEYFDAEAHVDTSGERPLLDEIRFRVAEAFKPHWLARIKKGGGRIRFGRDENGRPIILCREIDVAGSKLFGSLDYEESVRFRKHRYVGERAEAGSGEGEQGHGS